MGTIGHLPLFFGLQRPLVHSVIGRGETMTASEMVYINELVNNSQYVVERNVNKIWAVAFPF